jgi:hypothetical protein
MIYQLSARAKNGYHKDEYLITAEFPMAAGRIFGLAIAFLVIQIVPVDVYAYRILFVIISVAWLIEYFVIDKQVGWLKEG